MLKLSPKELKLIAKSKSSGIKGYKSMSEDKLLSALNASESVKENERYSKDTDLTKNEDYDAGEIIKKTTMPDLTKTNKTTRETRKNIVMNTKYLET